MATKAMTHSKERIGRVGQRRQIVIPRDLFDQLRMNEGDFVAFRLTGNGVLVKPKRLVDRDDVLSAAEARKVRRGMHQIKEGRFKGLKDVAHALGR
jgi:bifunctional DNA-binding transcriptional regulator/antitoxin component of YhaV-PrlF toxin-antitoxin module